MDDPLIWVSAVHFAATISVSGVVQFQALVGDPALRVVGANEPMAELVRRRLARIAWSSLALVVLSGAAWLMLQSAQMSERPLAALWSEGVLWTVLFGTDYGRLLLVKIVLFLVMLSVAAVNRLRLTPRLVQELNIFVRCDALRQLRNNSLIEASIGAIIILIVGALGTLPPGLHE